MANLMLSSKQVYAAGALLAIALRQAQLHQADQSLAPTSASEDATAHPKPDARLWVHESNDLLHPVFRFLEIDSKEWAGLEEIALSSSPGNHIAEFLRMVFDCNETSPERSDQEIYLAELVDSMVISLQAGHSPAQVTKKKQHEVSDRGDDLSASAVTHETFDKTSKIPNILGMKKLKAFFKGKEEMVHHPECIIDEQAWIMDVQVNYIKKLTFVFKLLSACLSDKPQDKEDSHEKKIPGRKGYDARYRVSLRLLAKWIGIEWIKVEAMEMIVACSVIASFNEELQSEENWWSRWKKSGIVGAAAFTGGTLLVMSGGLVAPAIAAGFSALAPTLGTLVPAIGASGFGAAAQFAGSVASAAASYEGRKLASRVEGIEDFDFLPIGENHNQGRLAVGIYVSGFVFKEDDFIRPWGGIENNLERYVLKWDSKNLISVSTGIQDSLTSSAINVLGTVVSAVAYTTLLPTPQLIDSKWSTAIDRSDKAGKLLAQALLKELQGNKPVTLVGFSLGARVVFKCLEELAKSEKNEGLIERVFLLGAPISVRGEKWESARKMVAGRFVNAFSKHDSILHVTFRASMMSLGLAGTQAVDVPGIENVDISNVISGHSSYICAAEKILQQLEA
ncbi:hypothetical protein Cni_G13987 [Canna indica]|uniref:Uncharacterized protein n=1 Tax=Canna indica TaxID=4628 RepID=A0AAQ3KB69_9LILI|nr:hypothetical protein Cni_G13987 [Canna indica]